MEKHNEYPGFEPVCGCNCCERWRAKEDLRLMEESYREEAINPEIMEYQTMLDQERNYRRQFEKQCRFYEEEIKSLHDKLEKLKAALKVLL